MTVILKKKERNFDIGWARLIFFIFKIKVEFCPAYVLHFTSNKRRTQKAEVFAIVCTWAGSLKSLDHFQVLLQVCRR